MTIYQIFLGEKKCDCHMQKSDLVSLTNLSGVHHANNCQLSPLYTPPAQEKLFDCSGCTDQNSEGTHQGHSKQHGCVGCLHNEPPQPKEPEAWEEQIVEILGLEKKDAEWRLITRNDNDEIIHYVDYSDAVQKLSDLIIPARQEAATKAREEERERIIENMKSVAIFISCSCLFKGQENCSAHIINNFILKVIQSL